MYRDGIFNQVMYLFGMKARACLHSWLSGRKSRAERRNGIANEKDRHMPSGGEAYLRPCDVDTSFDDRLFPTRVGFCGAGVFGVDDSPFQIRQRVRRKDA